MRGRELLLDLQRSDWLPAYDEDGVRQVLVEASAQGFELSEALDLRSRQNKTSTNNDNIPPYILYLKGCFYRNIKYSHAYFLHRMGKIRSLRWETGPVLPDHLNKDTLSTAEQDYFNDYNRLLSEYQEAIDVDLTADLEPPQDLMVEIRVLQNCGEIITENGPVSLDGGSTHYLRRSDVEHLIRHGKVEMFSS